MGHCFNSKRKGSTKCLIMAATKLRPTFAFRKRLEFLASGKLHLKDSVNTITFSYTTSDKSCIGLRCVTASDCLMPQASHIFILNTQRQFISKELPPIQYKNPEVQMVLFKNAHHYKFPAVKIYYSVFIVMNSAHCILYQVLFDAAGNGRCVMLDVEGKQPDAILAELTAIAGKTE